MSNASIKKATNITLSADVIVDAKAFGINISQSCDQYLRELIRQEKEKRWTEQYSEFIIAYNQIVSQEELPLDKWRTF